MPTEGTNEVSNWSVWVDVQLTVDLVICYMYFHDIDMSLSNTQHTLQNNKVKYS